MKKHLWRIMGLLFLFSFLFHGSFAQELDNGLKEATLVDGVKFNETMKFLANGKKIDYTQYDISIQSIKKSDTLPGESIKTEIVSQGGTEPVYLWYYQGTIYYYTDADIIYMNPDSSKMFYEMRDLRNISALGDFDTSKVENISSMFFFCDDLTDISPLVNWNTSNVENMYYMFTNCRSLQDFSALSNWDTSSVTDMGLMFWETKIKDLSVLSKWDVSNVKIMRAMFRNCRYLNDASAVVEWNVVSVQDFRFMFKGTSLLGSDYSFNVRPGYVDNEGTYIPFHTIVFDANGGSEVDPQTVAENGTGTKPSDPTRDGYSFQYRYLTGHENTPFDFKNTPITENTTLYAKWIKVVTVSFDVNGGNERIAPITGNYNEPITAPTEPTRASHRFLHRYLSGDNANNAFDFSTPITGDITLIANWKKKSSNNGGGGSSSSETTTGSTTNTGDNNINTGSTNTGTVNTGTVNTGTNNDKINTGSNNTGTVEDDNGFPQEFIDAYNFAFQNGITTMPTIDQADMTGNLTRIQMAKMLSYYAINIMGKKPDETRNNKFNDVSEKLDADYNSGVMLAYQLGIMGINMPNNNFRPNDLVTRGEFVTALSRMIYGTDDGEYENTSKYYTKHIEKLNEEEIIKQIDPSMKELRAYVMMMLKRASEK